MRAQIIVAKIDAVAGVVEDQAPSEVLANLADSEAVISVAEEPAVVGKATGSMASVAEDEALMGVAPAAAGTSQSRSPRTDHNRRNDGFPTLLPIQHNRTTGPAVGR